MNCKQEQLIAAIDVIAFQLYGRTRKTKKAENELFMIWSALEELKKEFK